MMDDHTSSANSKTRNTETSSVPDIPVWTSKADDFSEVLDPLKTYPYAESLGKFIETCDTPLTIGIQGEWGSGKTSLLNMIEAFLVRRTANFKNRSHQTAILRINTWEHALLRTPEETLLSIIREIIVELQTLDSKVQSDSSKPNPLATLKKVGTGVMWTAITAAGGRFAVQEAKEHLENLGQDSAVGSEFDENLIKQLRNELTQLVETVKNAGSNKAKRFVIFIDDLDRLEPATAVQVLELLKNIFEIPDTVFVLAIDYQVVVKGLRGKFGKQTKENDWEFRAFFDKIIQVPFLMPTARYQLGDYVNQLLSNIQYFRPAEKKQFEKGDAKKKSFELIVQKTVGRNPRALKRLANSLSLNRLHAEHLNKLHSSAPNSGKLLSDLKQKELLFALVCFEIGFPNIFEILLLNSQFTEWTDEGARRFIQSKGKDPNPADFVVALNAVRENSELFRDVEEDEWQSALFRVVWAMGWQRQRIVEAIEVLKQIDVMLGGEPESRKASMKEAIQMAATTSVVSADSGASFGIEEDSGEDGNIAHKKSAYWREFSSYTNSSSIWQPIRDPMVSPSLHRLENGGALNEMKWIATDSTGNFISLVDQGHEMRDFLDFLGRQGRITKLQKNFNVSIHVEIDEAATGEHKLIVRPGGISKRAKLWRDDKAGDRKLALEWMRDCFPEMRDELIRLKGKHIDKSGAEAAEQTTTEDSTHSASTGAVDYE